MKEQDDKSSKFKYSKYKARELTDFFSEELVYDYITKSIDSERQQAFEKHLLKSNKVKEKLAHTNAVLNQIEELNRIRISEEVMILLQPQRKSLVGQFKKGLRSQQFQSRKYFYLQYIFIFSAISFFVFLTPWRQLIPWMTFDNEGKVVLTEVRNSKDDIKKRMQARQDEMANDKTTEFTDEADDEVAVADAVAVSNPPQPAVPEKATEVGPPASPGKAPLAKVPTPAQVEANLKAPTKVEGAVVAAADTGYVYRGTVRIASLEVNGEKITEYIKSIGGRKAGDVELGWKKGPKTLYYHFTVPESKYEELKTYMERFGRTKLSKDKHPRKMPQGIIRLIVEVEESS